jgi:hypothetical protein
MHKLFVGEQAVHELDRLQCVCLVEELEHTAYPVHVASGNPVSRSRVTLRSSLAA